MDWNWKQEEMEGNKYETEMQERNNRYNSHIPYYKYILHFIFLLPFPT